jgi:plastocyanin domain-containing protein
MTGTEWAVIAAGVGLIAAVIWWFFGESAGTVATSTSSGVQEARIVVRGGYEPAVVRLEAGKKTRLVFDRQETSGCSEEVVFPDFGVRRFLPPFEKTEVELQPVEPGQYDFTCGMSMLHGKLIVEAHRE